MLPSLRIDYLLALLLILNLAFSPVLAAVAWAADDAEEQGEGESNSDPDADGDGMSDKDESSASEAAAADVAANAAAKGIDVSVSPVDSTKDANAKGGTSVSVNGVSMSVEAANAAIDAMANAASQGLAPGKGIDTGRTLSGYANGTIGCSGCVVGTHGLNGTPAEVAHNESLHEGRSTAVNSALTDTRQEAINSNREAKADLTPTDRVTSAFATPVPIADPATAKAVADYAAARAAEIEAKAPEENASKPTGITPVDNLTVDARMAAAGFNPDGSRQRSVTIDYGNLLGVTSGRVADYQANNTLDSKIALEQNMIGMALNSNIDKATNLGQVTPATIEQNGKMDNRDTNGSFAKTLDTTVAPDLWGNSTLTGRQELSMSYLSNVVGYTPNQAAAVVGNFTIESGNLNHLAEAAGTERSSGLAQWNSAAAAGQRQQALENYAGVQFANKQNGSWTTGPGAFTQLSFATAEMKGTAGNNHRDVQAETVGRNFANQPDISVNEATKEFQNNFERPSSNTASLGSRQNAANAALAAYNEVNPSQSSIAANHTGDQPQSQPQSPGAMEKGSTAAAGQSATPAVSVEVGGVTVTVDPSGFFSALGGLFSGLFGGSGSKTDSYTSLPGGEGNGQDNPALQEIVVTPGRPAACPAGSNGEGFAFSIKLSTEVLPINAYSCTGQTTADYFTAIASYLRGYFPYIQDADILRTMKITSP